MSAALFVTEDANKLKHLTLAVDGVHCPACIQKIESGLASFSGVTEARLNYTTKRLALIWNGEAAMADSFVRKLEDGV